MLPLRGAFAEPAIVGQVHKKIGVVCYILASEMREYVFETDQGCCFYAQLGHDKRHSAFARRENVPNPWREIFEERQKIDQRQILTEDYQVTLAVARDQFALRTDEKTAVEVEVLGFLMAVADLFRFRIICSDDHPKSIAARQSG